MAYSTLEDEASADFVGGTLGRNIIKLGGVNRETERSLDTRAECLSVTCGEIQCQSN